MVLQEMNEVKQVGGVERAVLKEQQFFQVSGLVVYDKIKRRVVHGFHQGVAIINDGFAISPCQRGRKKSADLDVLSS